MGDAVVSGHVAPGLEGLETALSEILAGEDAGAAVAVYRHGREVAYLHGGERAPGRPWTASTLGHHMSAAKAFQALCIQILADRGQLDVYAPVAECWPEFAQAGKERVTVAMILDHSAGLPTFARYWEVFTLDDPAAYARSAQICERLAGEPPLWPPGSVHGYHSETYCWMVGEIVRRVSGRPLGTFVREEIAEPLGIADELYAGVPRSQQDRMALLIPDAEMDGDEFARRTSPLMLEGRGLLMGGMRVGDVLRHVFFRPEVLEQDAPDSIYATARASARVLGLLANGGELDGVRLVSEASIRRHTARRSNGPCAIWGSLFSFGLGYMRPTATLRFGPGDAAFGHSGMGGAVTWADPEAGVSFAFLPATCRRHQATDGRWTKLVEQIYGWIDRPEGT